MIFLGLLFSKEREKEILSLSKHGIMNASNQFQMDLLHGMQDNDTPLQVVHTLPVGAWPRHYRQPILKDEIWQLGDTTCRAVGSINLPVIKQWQREKRIRRLLKKMTKDDREIIIYSAYLPYLRAVRKLPQQVKITLIVPDLPEFYDLGKTTGLRRMLRKMNNKMIEKCLQRVNRYVLLTAPMAERLNIQDKPHIVVEGIYHNNTVPSQKENTEEQKIIFYAGTLHEKFGLRTLMDAFSLLPDPDAYLWICGNGDMAEFIRRQAAQDKRIRYFGYISSAEVEKLQQQAMVLVNPRSNEGEYTKYSFPSKTMGYMASGKPVVMYKLDGIPAEYDPYLTYIRGTTPEEMKAALEKVFSMTAEERKALGAQARQFVLERKSPHQQAQKVLQLIQHHG